MAAWRRLNFGFRLLAADRLSVTAIRAEIERYDAHDSAVVTDWIREHASDTEAWTACQAVHRQARQARAPWTAEAASRVTFDASR